ncbi:hypothetical protein E2C01_044003 [Portunus trituberculatus]|uniref:Uncharacterized protein n=1 Tax=Portunus trituberculatus TaxID=210409 RepID=A0A5B7FQX2_PORTR|nr:hypothetical protein [Portunus trituberculatus]
MIICFYLQSRQTSHNGKTQMLIYNKVKSMDNIAKAETHGELEKMTSSNKGADMKVRRQRITTQAKKIILSVHKHLRDQDEKISETDLEIRTSAATGISVSSLHRIKQQSKWGRIQSPSPRTRKAPVLGAVDDHKRDYIRREILSFYERKEVPSIDALLRRVRGLPVGFSGCVSTLRKLVMFSKFESRAVSRKPTGL